MAKELTGTENFTPLKGQFNSAWPKISAKRERVRLNVGVLFLFLKNHLLL